MLWKCFFKIVFALLLMAKKKINSVKVSITLYEPCKLNAYDMWNNSLFKDRSIFYEMLWNVVSLKKYTYKLKLHKAII